MVAERRSTPRVRAYRPVRLSRWGSPRIIETLTKDLALGGMRCLSPDAFPVSTELEVELVLAPGEEIFTTRGRVAWFRMLPKSDQFDLGITFLGLTAQHLAHLSAHLSRLATPHELVHA